MIGCIQIVLISNAIIYWALLLMRLLFVTKVKLINFPITVFQIFRISESANGNKLGDDAGGGYEGCIHGF